MTKHSDEKAHGVNMNPRWYQQQANDAAWHYMRTTKGNPLIVLPTGSGKSFSIAMMCQQALSYGADVVVLAHRKELLRQNADELRDLIPDASIGIYSAGLGERRTTDRVIFGGIQSVYNKTAELGPRKLIIVDEAHLIGSLEETMYRTFINRMIELNPGIRIVGLTATPFRTSEGPICGPGKLFNRIVFEAQTKQLIDEGFLCPITNRPTTQVETDRINLNDGEFNLSHMQHIFNQNDTVELACRELLDKASDRKSIIVFASGVKHAENIAETLNRLGEWSVGVVTGETIDLERSAILSDFTVGNMRIIINIDVLTTGFNARRIDCIAIMRATMSPGLFCQMCGRGLRKHESKQSVLLLDFGGNLKRHGSIDDLDFGRPRTTGDKRQAKADANGRGKQCPSCGLDVAANARTCPECEFLFPVNHDSKADTDSQVVGKGEPETKTVDSVSFRIHKSRDPEKMIPTVRVDYFCKEPTDGDLKGVTISEWICPEHSGFARSKFEAWWDEHTVIMDVMPNTVQDVVDLLKLGVARWPVSIVTQRDGKFTKILSCDFGERQKPTQLTEREPEREYSGVGEDIPF